MYFSYDISLECMWWLLACVLCILALIAIYFWRVRTVVEYRRKADAERPEKPDSEYLPASVIIYSQGEAENLTELLESVLSQDYPAAYEVVVVNDGESADVRDAVSFLRATHPNLYLTFTPEGVVNLSRKKLALTLGIKAARYDIVVLTTTAAVIPGKSWLRNMMSRFDKDGSTEVVLGFAYVDADEDERFGKRRRAFDSVVDSVRWLGVAIAGKPFRGTEYNIAYRKEAFLRNKGFAHTLNLHYGDDDIFVSEIANRHNTEVEISEDSLVRLRHGNHPRLFIERVLRRIFTEGFIRRKPRFLIPLTGVLQIAVIVCAVIASWLSWPNVLPPVAGLIMVAGMAALDIYVWRKAMKALKSRMLMFTIPWFSITLPLRIFSRRVRAKFGRQKKYTWN